MNKTKLLFVMGGSYMGVGGIESMVINYYRHLDKTKFQIDFVFFGEGVGLYDDEIRSNGGRLFHLPIKGKHPIKSNFEMKKLLNAEKYDIVHAHLNAAGIYTALKVAAKCGVRTRISHAHSTSHGTTNKIKVLLNEYARKRIVKYSTHNFACSDLAGEWYYGNKPYTVISNAIEAPLYVYNNETRNKIRTEMNSTDKFIVGHVGSLGYPKNQSYLLDIFKCLSGKRENIELWIIGDGEDKPLLLQKATDLGISENIRFLGRRSNVNEFLQAMDAFVLPSFFEGFPVVMVEAVAADLSCFVSDTITKTVMLSDKVKILSINASPEIWANSISESTVFERNDNTQLIKDKGFDISTEALKLENFYLNGGIK